jgi:primosomal protein N' (replication factor Y)
VGTRALDRPLDYLVPAGRAGDVAVGSLVAVPLGRRTVLGVVVGAGPATFEGRLVPIAGVVAAPPVPEPLVELARWIARYDLAPVAACLRLVLPPRAEGTLRRRADGGFELRPPPPPARERLVARDPRPGGTARQQAIGERLAAGGGAMPAADLCRAAGTTLATLRRMEAAGLLRLSAEAPSRSALDWLGARASPEPDVPPELTAEQAGAVAAIEAAMGRGPGGLLLHGVTGSGKTEVYLRAIAAAAARGRTALVLVPEIALTPQALGRLRARLGERVALWHSALAPGERAAEDARIRAGEVDVVVGARSAVFAPLPRLGLIVVDEEHDGSYKQDASPRYDARQVAYRRALLEGALVVYGSATPRPESWHALPRVTLAERADGGRLPPVQVVDMRVQPPGPVSRPLAEALREAVARREKAIVLLNRRGLARMALCRACGWIGRCPDCDVALVVHRAPDRLVCHHCGLERPVPLVCPACAAVEVVRQGSGTQGLEQALRTVVPDARLVRLDADSVARRGALAERLADFARPGAAVLLGTQMVAKGHDLPDITVAAVLDADGALQYPDFRSEERTFALIVQLAGRAGRRGEPSRVIVQAYEPGGRAVALGARHAVAEFLDGELVRRAERGLPPYRHLVRVVVEGAAAEVNRIAGSLAAGLRAEGLDPLGPVTLHRLRGRARRALLLRAPRAGDLTAPLQAVLAPHAASLHRDDVRVVVDVDPQDT